MAKPASSPITHAVVRMYCMGTGDCFIIKFFRDITPTFTLMIDCGVWSGSVDHLRPFMQDLKTYTGGNIDLLIVTHEHKDHVSVFEACEDLLTTGFTVKQTWMAWTENDKQSTVKQWKSKYGEKAVALAIASEQLEKAVNSSQTKEVLMQAQKGKQMLEAKQHFANVLSDFSALSVTKTGSKTYKGALPGMQIAKTKIAKNRIEFKNRGDIIEDLPGAKGVRFYVLGPPETYDEVKTEGGGEGESYTHNTILKKGGEFGAAVLSRFGSDATSNTLPFDPDFESHNTAMKRSYKDKKNAWRTIDNDWLFSAGALALRMSTLTNNLSLALAIEFEDSKRVMLFPGDAEYGSWASWHSIDWKGLKAPDGGHYTKDLLNRTVFYKIAHHMSHNGTAQRLGMDMMTHKDLAAMATLDYTVIPPGWAFTMPNRELLAQLLSQAKGRLMIMNERDIFADFHDHVPIGQRIAEAQKKMNPTEKADFNKSFKRQAQNMYLEYTVQASG